MHGTYPRSKFSKTSVWCFNVSLIPREHSPNTRDTNTSTAPRTASQLRPDWPQPGERLTSHSTLYLRGVMANAPLWQGVGGGMRRPITGELLCGGLTFNHHPFLSSSTPLLENNLCVVYTKDDILAIYRLCLYIGVSCYRHTDENVK